ncbi:hypothetical protein H9P43_007859 [Blastocladiella emersonii ATCC 22665]|nr:hypothetical protein H9P43_007859 [Blastocladiella emersonii ATCC 22665]
MKTDMTVTLNIPELIERVLCFAVWSLSRDDLDGFQQIAGVTHANLIPRVHKAILRHSSYHTADKAMRTGHVALLSKYLRFQPVTLKGIDALNAAMASPSQALLEQLDFSVNSHDAYFGTRLLERLPRGLKSLKIKLNKYGDHLVLAILKSLPHSVTELNLDENELTAAGLAEMGPYFPPALESLSLIGNKLGNRDSKSIPSCWA